MTSPSPDRTLASPARQERGLALSITALCAAFGLIDTLQRHIGNELRGTPRPFMFAVHETLLPWLWLAALAPLVVYLARRMPLGRGRWRRSLPVHLVAMLLFWVAHQAGAALLVYTTSPTTASFNYMLVKLLLYGAAFDPLIYWAIVGATHAVRSAHEAHEREEVAARLEASLSEARLTALRDRLNPHFLFNTLNAVTTLALRGDHDSVVRTLSALSDLLRVTLDDARGQEVPLAEELAFLDRYLEIQELRFGDRLTIVRSVDDAVLDAAFPAMLTQPLVENAVQHGVAVKPGPVRIEVKVRRESDALVLDVVDTGPGFGATPAKAGNGIGLANCRARLVALYGQRARLACADVPAGGAMVTVTIPYRPLAPADP